MKKIYSKPNTETLVFDTKECLLSASLDENGGTITGVGNSTDGVTQKSKANDFSFDDWDE